MDFVNINSTYSESDRPRSLTNDEIDAILDYLPTTYSADAYEGQLIREAIRNDLREKLMYKKIAPSAINNIANDIVKYYTTSRIAAGLSVGANAAESSAHSPMQSALNSVAPWEKLILQDKNGNGFITEIGPWIDNLLDNNKEKIQHIPKNKTELLELDEPVYIETCNDDGKASWEVVTHVTKHLPNGDLVKIKTKSGREVNATQSKSLLIWDDKLKKIVPIKGKHIKIGDMVPILNQVPNPPKVYYELDLRKYLSPKEWIYMSEVDKLYQIYNGRDNKRTRFFWSKQDYLSNLPYSRGDAFLDGVKDMQKKDLINNNCVYPKAWGHASNSRIPEKITLDKNFGQFVGLYLADGCVSDTFLSITKDEPSILSFIYDFCDRFSINHHTVHSDVDLGHKVSVFIHSVLFARLFKKWLKSGSSKKFMPEEILFGNDEFIKGVLDGYIAGDGTVSKTDGSITVGSVSENLINGVSYLCSRVGIFGKKTGSQQKSNNLGTKNILYTHAFTIRNLNADKWRDIIGCCNKSKVKIMNKNYLRNAGWGLQYIKHNDVMLDPVVSIEYVKGVEYVYDLTIPSTLNFSLYNRILCRDSFHSSGASKSGSSGINGIEELLYLKKEKKNEICTVHFKNKSLSYEEVLDTKKDIVGVTISDLIDDYLYIKEGNNYVKNIEIDLYRNLSKKWFHNNNYIKDVLESVEPPDDAYVLRIKLNLYQLYIYKVTIQDIIDTFKREYDSPIHFIYGSLKDAIIDIYACSDYVEKKNGKFELKAVDCNDNLNNFTSAAYYQTIIVPSFNTLRIKGVQNITNLTPIVVPVVSIILNDNESVFILKTDNNIEKLSVLLDLVGISVKETGDDEYILKMPIYDNSVIDISKDEYEMLTPITYLQKIVDLANNPVSQKLLNNLKSYQLTKAYIITLSAKIMRNSGIDKSILIDLLKIANINIIKIEDLKIYVDRPSSQSYINKLTESDNLVKRASEVIHAEVTGRNLRGLLALDIVDQQRTISNNIHVIANVLGIRAARSYFIKDLYNVMSGFGLHPQHVITIADVFFSKGVPLGAQALSANKNLGPMDKASVAKAADVFRSSSILGTSHDITGVASNIIFGLAPKVGTGYLDVGYNDKKMLINTDIYKRFKDVEETKEELPLIKPTVLVGKKVTVAKPKTTTASSTIISKYQRPIDPDKTEKKTIRRKK